MIIGDFGHFFGLKTQYNITFIILSVLTLISQLIHFYNYKSGIKQTYFKVFDMMSGSISPKSIGLTNKEEFYKLIKESKILFSIDERNIDKVIPLMAFLLCFVSFIINCSLLDLMTFGIPYSLLQTFSALHLFYNVLASRLLSSNLSLH